MKIAYVQFQPVLGDVENNRKKMAAICENLQADILVLPELSTSGYFFTSKKELAESAETIPGPSTDFFSSLAGMIGGRIIAGIPEHGEDGLYNSVIMTGPSGLEGVYRKAHLFNEEKKVFKPGGEEFLLRTLPDGTKIGILNCFDHMFPEAARTLALKGAQIICHPSNLVMPELAQLTTRVRAIENRVFWIMANRWGSDTGADGRILNFTGESQIISPKGKILARAPKDGDALHIVEIDPAESLGKSINEYNNLFEDRRTDLYHL